MKYDIMPFTFADVLILRYLLGDADEFQTVDDFTAINLSSDLKWSFKRHITKFIKRFWSSPYKKEEEQWMQKLSAENGIKAKHKFARLSKLIQQKEAEGYI